MKSSEFYLAVWNRTLTAEELKNFYEQTSKSEVKEVFKVIASAMVDPYCDKIVKVGYTLIENNDSQFKNFNEFSEWFGGLIKGVGNPYLLRLFVSDIMCCEEVKSRPDYRMSEDLFEWLLKDVCQSKADLAMEIFGRYASKRKFTRKEQLMLLNNSNLPIWKRFVDLTEMDCYIQHLMIKSFSEEAAEESSLEKLEYYCKVRRLCEEAEVLMAQERKNIPSCIIKDYAFRWGWCNRAMSGLLTQLIYSVIG